MDYFGNLLPMVSILFENDDIVAVNKPEGLAAIPERTKGQVCLLALLSAQFPGKLYVVHRLDKEVSGVILFAKHAAAHKCLNDQFADRKVRKTYIALTLGLISADSGIIDKPIRQFGSGRMGIDMGRGKPCTTEFQVIERFEGYTLINVFPRTGRRHQIRVHLYSLGHPIVGDLRYGEKAKQKRFPRLMLHAHRIEFQLPSGGQLALEAPIPESFEVFIRSIKSPH